MRSRVAIPQTSRGSPISEDLEVWICTGQGLDDENVAIESFELYIQGEQ